MERNIGDVVFRQLSSGRYIMEANRKGSVHSGVKEESEVRSYHEQGIKVEIIDKNGSRYIMQD